MKSKKKLLVAMAAMSVAAIGAGTVSTFAWYTTANTVKIQTAADAYDLAAAASTVSVANVRVKVVLSSNESKAVELTDGTGYTGAMVGGNVVTQAETAAKTIGQIDITSYFVDSEGRKSGDTGYVAPTSDQLAALQNKYWFGTFTAGGNVVILNSDSSSVTGNEVATGHFRIAFGADGTISGTEIKTNENHFAIRTNNKYGSECFLTSESANANYAKGQSVTATEAPGTPVKGAAYIYETNHFKVYTGSAWENGGWAHALDKLTVTVDAGSAVVASGDFA